MSLINDALKRATNDKPKSGQGAPATPPLTPADESRQNAPGVLPLVLCIVGLGALVVAGGFWIKAKGTASGPRVAAIDDAQLKPRSADSATPAESVAASGQSTAPAQKAVVAADSSQEQTTAVVPPRNPIERAAATLSKVQQQNTEGETEADQMISARPVATAPAPVAATPTQHAKAGTTRPAGAPFDQKPQPDAAIEPSSPAPRYKLQAIYYRMKGPTVILNGKTHKVGDTVNGAKIIAIHRNSVDLEISGEKETLTLH